MVRYSAKNAKWPAHISVAGKTLRTKLGMSRFEKKTGIFHELEVDHLHGHTYQELLKYTHIMLIKIFLV